MIIFYLINNLYSIQKIKIGYLPITHANILFIQKELFKTKKYEIELIKFNSWPELIDSLNTGRIDGSSVLIELAIKSKEIGFDLKCLALGHRDGNVVIVEKNFNNSLKGKTFSIPHKQSSHNILLYLLAKKNNLTLNDFNIIELPPPEMPVSLFEKKIDGYIVAEPFGAKSVDMGIGKVLYYSKDLWENSICCGLVFRNKFIEDNKQLVIDFLNDYLYSGKYIENNKKNILPIIKKYLNVNEKVLELSLQWIYYDNLSITEKDYNKLINYMLELNLIKKPINYNDFIYNATSP